MSTEKRESIGIAENLTFEEKCRWEDQCFGWPRHEMKGTLLDCGESFGVWRNDA
jgi:hypothetical protein